MSFRSILNFLSCKNQLCKKNFFDLVVDGVRWLYPFHLIGRFLFFRYALLCLHLTGQLLQTFLAGAADFLWVFHELAGEQKACVQFMGR